MNENWKNCCRLCGKKDHKGKNSINTLVFTRNNQEIAKKYFSIKLLPLEGRESLVCHDCCSFLTKLDDFGRKCCKIDQMFNDLISKENFSKDVQDIRNKFGVDPGLKLNPLHQDNEEDTNMYFLEEETKEETDNVIVMQEVCLENEPPPLIPLRGISMKFDTTKLPGICQRTNICSTALKSLPDIPIKSGSTSFMPQKEKITKQKISQTPRKKTRTYSCDKCFKSFSSEAYLELHQFTHLPEQEGLVESCPHCKKLFTSKNAVEEHIIAFHGQENMNTKEKSFVCEICGMVFKQFGTLIGHKIIHSDERPFKCSICLTTYNRKSELKRHLLLHKGIKFSCSYCDVKLTSKAGLKRHQLVHSDVKKYKCNRCGDEFKRSCSLKKHLIKHMGLRLYKCQFCGKMYTDGSSCRNHKKKYHPVELAEFEATGKTVEVTRAPKLEWLQPKSTVEDEVEDQTPKDDTNTEN